MQLSLDRETSLPENLFGSPDIEEGPIAQPETKNASINGVEILMHGWREAASINGHARRSGSSIGVSLILVGPREPSRNSNVHALRENESGTSIEFCRIYRQ